MTALVVGLCGGLGAVLRFLVDTGVRRRWPTAFPVGTLLINVTGSLVLGAATAAIASTEVAGIVPLAMGVGLCGGYTTFSTAMAETVGLARDRLLGRAVLNLFGTTAGTVLAAALGYALVAALAS